MDMTTPKRNEAVAIRPYLWITQEDQRRVSQDEDCVIACPHIASAPSDAVYLYHSDDYAALQGEVSRLREALDRLVLAAHSAAHSCNTALMDQAIDLARDALNLEPTTDGL